jgi:hypothetical protein
LPDRRDRALIAALSYSLARINAGLRDEGRGPRSRDAGCTVKLHEKGSKQDAGWHVKERAMNLIWWTEHSSQLALLLLAAVATHLLMSFSQTVMHYRLGHRRLGGIFLEITSIFITSIIRRITWHRSRISKTMVMATTHHSF